MHTEPKNLSCEYCGETFQRREHRDRHLLRHTGLKPFLCHICSKSFSRNDSLVRHRSLHGAHSRDSGSQGRRRGQACLPCSKLKQRCDGGLPCARCSVRDSECSYNPPRPSGRAAPSPGTDNDDHLQSKTQGAVTRLTGGDHLRPSDLSNCVAQAADVSVQRVRGGELNVFSEEWSNHPLGSSASSNITNIAVSTLCSPPLDRTVYWQHPSTLPADMPANDAACNFACTADELWMPWNPLLTSLSLPWLMDGSELSMEQPVLSGLEDKSPPAAHFPGSSPASGWTNEATHLGRAPCVQTYLGPENICGGYTRPCRRFPEPQAASVEMAGTEIYGHVQGIPEQASESLHRFYMSQHVEPTSVAITQRILHAFVELYFEYFNPQFPFLHPSRLEDPELPWILLLATAAVGSQYSEIQGAEQYSVALCDLLARAVESTVDAENIVTAQSVFLLHILWMFSGSHQDKIILQRKRSILVTLCWALLGKADKRTNSMPVEPGPEKEWQDWLSAESRIRLVTCVRVLECLGSIFLGTPLFFYLRDFTRQLPCSEALWQCRNARDWKTHQRTLPEHQADQRRGHSDQGWARLMLECQPFASKVILLELFIDERSIARQLCSSQLLRSSFTSHLSTLGQGSVHAEVNPAMLGLDISKSESNYLDTAISLLAYVIPDGCATAAGGRSETIFHVLAMLRRVPLETLHSATGWQTDEEQMLESKTRLKDFFLQSGARARECLWHAAYIFKTTRNCRRFACYDALSLMVAICYIYCYSELCMAATQSSAQMLPASDGAPRGQARPSVVRLDQLHEKSAIERWIESGADSIVHLTGVGLLDGSDQCVRFLRDVEKTLSSQIAWRGFSLALAGSFAQLRRGEMPTRKDSNED